MENHFKGSCLCGKVTYDCNAEPLVKAFKKPWVIYIMNNKENRKLSTILAMDVVGYSSKMADDDEGTLKLLAERRLIIEKNTKNYGGRIFNTAGDAFMIDFSSPVEAVKAAIKIQQEIFHLNKDLIGKKQLEFRVGINMGTASHHLGKKENAQKYFDRVKELLGGENTLDALKKEAAIWHEMTVIEEMMPVYLEYGLK